MLNSRALEGAAKRILNNFSIPVRPTNWNGAPFWALPLTLTRARPLPAGGGWVDFFTVPVNNLFSRVIHKYILTPRTEGQVEFRWLKGGRILSLGNMILPVTVERHIDRLAAHPYPCRWRDTFIIAKHDQDLRVQCRNLSQSLQLIYGAVYGWYYPSLKSPDEVTPDTGINDAVRST